MKILKAQMEDSETLSRIAFAAKSYWKYPQSRLNLWKKALTITPEFIQEQHVYKAIKDEKTVGFYALVLIGNVAQVEHLWISPDFIGAGIGKKMFAHALQKAREMGANSMEIESDPNAEEFYRKQGAEKFGESVTEIEGEKRVLPLMRINLTS